jgi:hypothetical protein
MESRCASGRLLRLTLGVHMNSNAELGGACIGLVVSIFVFFITRELWCWYFKINVAVAELRGIRAELEKLNARDAKRIADSEPSVFAPR